MLSAQLSEGESLTTVVWCCAVPCGVAVRAVPLCSAAVDVSWCVGVCGGGNCDTLPLSKGGGAVQQHRWSTSRGMGLLDGGVVEASRCVAGLRLLVDSTSPVCCTRRLHTTPRT